MLGLSEKDNVTEELIINSTFIRNNYPSLTIHEIRLAYTLSITGKLEDVEFYGNFSPLYMAKVINSYLYYRKIMLADVIRKKEKHDQYLLEQSNKPTPEEQAELTKEIFSDFYKQWQETGEISDVFNICYYFLRPKDGSRKLFSPTKEEVDLASQWGKQKALMLAQKKDNFRIEIGEDDYKKWARNWCVQNYFKTVDIGILLNNIKPELFS